VEVVSAPQVTPPSKSAARLLIPFSLALVLGAGAFWLQGRPGAAPTTGSSEAPVASAPAAMAPFTLTIDSEPPGASVTEGSTRLGTTPFSLSLSLAESASPRVFVVEKEGYQPYVVRQGAARGEVRVMAALTQRVEEAAAPSATPAAKAAPVVAPVPPAVPPPVRAQRPAPAKKTPPPITPPSDIRLER
jgi:hypothetical protein